MSEICWTNAHRLIVRVQGDQLQEFIKERDTTGAIEELLWTEASMPEKMLPGVWQVRWALC